MNLYEADYTKQTEKYAAAIKEYNEFWSQGLIDFSKASDPIEKFDDETRKFIYNFNSKFPNNVVWHYHRDRTSLDLEVNALRKVINSAKNEHDIQDYIKKNRKWFIPASIFKEYNFGHKETYLFPEMKLGSSMQADYVLCGRNSDGYSLILVEFESPASTFVLTDGYKLSASANSGLGQINQWKEWMESNYTTFFNDHKFTEKGINVPITRIHYCLVISRRNQMETKDRDRKNRIIIESTNLNIINYDRVCDYVSNLDEGYSTYR